MLNIQKRRNKMINLDDQSSNYWAFQKELGETEIGKSLLSSNSRWRGDSANELWTTKCSQMQVITTTDYITMPCVLPALPPPSGALTKKEDCQDRQFFQFSR